MKPKMQFLEKKKKEIINAYQNGESLDSIAPKYSVNPSTIRKFLLSHLIILRPPIRPQKLIKDGYEVIKLYKTGLNTQRVASQFNVDRNTVSSFLKKNKMLRDAPLGKRSFHILNDTDKGLLAGLLLGEGSIVMVNRGAQIRIANNEKEILEYLSKFGGRIYWTKPKPPRSPNPGGIWNLPRIVDVYYCLQSIVHLLVGKKYKLAIQAIHLIEKNYGLREIP
jgi:DNA-binding CsgD family transcriptional regulator